MIQPKIIQGGMGVSVSCWRLARAVSMLGQLGVVSGTALDTVLARRLQLGDPGGHMRRAMQAFPFPKIARKVLDDYFIDGGKPAHRPFRAAPVFSGHPQPGHAGLTVLANFVEIFLAREGHDGPVGINFLEKIQLPTLPSLFGAMLAGVAYILMGAGIPRSIPGILDALALGQAVNMKLDVAGAAVGDDFCSTFDPGAFCEGPVPALRRPKFLPIVSSATLAMTLARKSNGAVDGFVVEGPVAGGHNAPPRGRMQLDASGEPVYSERDRPDIDKIRALGLPFWMAGAFASPEKLEEALSIGAAGVQIGTAFAFCEESGIDPALKREVLRKSVDGSLRVFTDPLASPTGFPFKVVQFPGSASDPAVCEERERVCDLGYLRHLYRKADGTLGYRCPAESAAAYLKKDGVLEDTAGRTCVCNGLMATAGLGQVRKNGRFAEPPLLTAGDDAVNLRRFLRDGRESYSAADVVKFVLG